MPFKKNGIKMFYNARKNKTKKILNNLNTIMSYTKNFEIIKQNINQTATKFHTHLKNNFIFT